MTRSHRRSRPNRKRLYALIGIVIVLAGVAIGIVMATSSPNKPSASSSGSTATTTLSASRCPLTDLPAPGGSVPQRPALMVKVGNEPDGARPQSGLNEADIVYDTPAEGFIMRYIAVYQCQNASSIGPTRSLRWVDSRIAAQLGHPILAFAGGIDQNVNPTLALTWLEGADLLAGAQNAAHRISTRVPPDNLYTSTQALYGLFPKVQTPPPTPFQFTAGLPSSAKPVTSLGIDFSEGTDVLWKWNAAGADFLHTYGGEQDVDALSGQPVSTTNIVVQVVTYKIGPYIESTGGTGDIESNTVGSGPGYVLRNGKYIAVTWHRQYRTSPLTFTDSSGQTVGLSPGRTWVEVVPDTVANETGGITISS